MTDNISLEETRKYIERFPKISKKLSTLIEAVSKDVLANCKYLRETQFNFYLRRYNSREVNQYLTLRSSCDLPFSLFIYLGRKLQVGRCGQCNSITRYNISSRNFRQFCSVGCSKKYSTKTKPVTTCRIPISYPALPLVPLDLIYPEDALRQYYVYLLLDTREEGKVPFYVGYGKKRRVIAHFKAATSKNLKAKVIRDILRHTGDWPEYTIVKKCLTSAEAKRLEIKLIARYGRIDLRSGRLVNHTAGGDGTVGSKNLTRKQRLHISETTRLQHANMTEGEKLIRGRKISKGFKLTYANMPEDLKRLRIDKMGEGRRKLYRDRFLLDFKKYMYYKLYKVCSEYETERTLINIRCRNCDALYTLLAVTLRRRFIENSPICQCC